MRENIYGLLLMLFIVLIGGELKFHPFNDDFRVSFGTTAFFFFLLWIRRIPSVVFGVLAGVSVILFRTGLDWMTLHPFHLEESIRHHLPSFFYYFCYSVLFTLTRMNQYQQKPLLLGLLGVAVEIVSNIGELMLRSSSVWNVLSLEIVGKIATIAIVRTFFVLGFFNMIQLREAKSLEEQQRHRNERMLMLISNLYEESIHLKKTLQHVEAVTRDCYDLYRCLQEPGARVEGVAQRVLKIAGQVHEIKKDNQRIYAGLSKLITNEHVSDYMTMEELGQMIVRTNQKYARMLAKEIEFECHVNVSPAPYHIYTILSLMNNLVANAVEAIRDAGRVTLSIVQSGEWITFRVCDDGPGIAVKDKELLFKPGFTTKYDVSGNPSTGIGLSYVKEMVEQLGGELTVEERTICGETVFAIRLPAKEIMRKGG